MLQADIFETVHVLIKVYQYFAFLNTSGVSFLNI